MRDKILMELNTNHVKVNGFDPYIISKLLRYLLAYNDSSLQAVEIFKSFSLLLTQTVLQRERALISATLDDPLIDLEVHDLVDIIRVYSAFANQSTMKTKGRDFINFVPALIDPEDDDESGIQI